jgi:hypothetical protein
VRWPENITGIIINRIAIGSFLLQSSGAEAMRVQLDKKAADFLIRKCGVNKFAQNTNVIAV